MCARTHVTIFESMQQNPAQQTTPIITSEQPSKQKSSTATSGGELHKKAAFDGLKKLASNIGNAWTEFEETAHMATIAVNKRIEAGLAGLEKDIWYEAAKFDPELISKANAAREREEKANIEYKEASEKVMNMAQAGVESK